MKVVHVMADGTERDSVEGLVIPYNEATRSYYNYMANLVREELRKQAQVNKEQQEGD
jgi:hypothetical protein